MTTDQGFVHAVHQHVYGSQIAADAATTTTVISVHDAADFNETGGTLTIRTFNGTDYDTTAYDYVSADLEADTVTLGVGGLTIAVVEGDKVRVAPELRVRRAQVVVEGSEDSITARIPASLERQLPIGIRDEGNREAVEVSLIDDEWVVRDVPGVAQTLTSSNNDLDGSGWALTDDGAMFDGLDVGGEMGAESITTNQMLLGDEDLQTDILDAMPLGQVALGVATIGTNSANMPAGNTELIVWQFNGGTVYAGRQYRITYQGSWNGTNTFVGDVYETRLRYTENGVNPTTSDTIMPGSLTRTGIDNAGVGMAFQAVCWYSPGSDCNLKIAWTGNRQSAGTGSTGTCAMKADSSNFQPFLSVEDMGLQVNVGGAIAQKSGLVQSDPGATYTRTWYATDSKTYNGDNSQRTGTPSVSCYQGKDPQGYNHGNEKSLIAFNDSDIRTQLTGATVTKVKFSFRVDGSGPDTNGVDVRIKDHNNSSLPSTYSAGSQVTPTAGQVNGLKAGNRYTWTLPNSFGTDLKNGNARGLGFFAPDGNSRYYGWMYGATATGSKPSITITYTK